MFYDDYILTIEDRFDKKFMIDGERVAVSILDTGGDEDCFDMMYQFIAQGEGFILVYSITSLDSLNKVKEIYTKITDLTGDKSIPVIIVGTQVDQESKREVMEVDGENFASSINAPFLEVSAKLGVNIEETFYSAVRRMNERYAAAHKF